MRILLAIVAAALAGYGIWYFGDSHLELQSKIQEIFDTGHFHTLEVRYTANQIMDSHRKELLKDNRHVYLEPILRFYPYLLLEVKYALSEDSTNEGVILWDQTDGEMVINTKDWDKTHGFGDCINANTERNEFKILNILAKKGGSIDRKGLTKALHVENDILDAWIDSCRKKQLVVQSGNLYRLHLQNPKLRTIPETKLEERLVTKPYRGAIRLHKRYSASQVERIAKAAFGHDFAIRKMTDIYLPVHTIVVQNPDDSIQMSHWNALNGRPLSNSPVMQ